MRLSVIVPAYNAAADVDRCLAALQASSFGDYETIVVDDHSDDDTPRIAARHGADVLALERRSGPARARNAAARRAQGEILVFIDADVCVHTDTLARFDAHFRDAPDADAVMGSYDDTPTDPHFVSQYKNLQHHYVHQQSRTNAWTFWAGCGAIRRDVFLRFGGFDESFERPSIEDIELGLRLHAAGHRIDLDPSIQGTHLKRWTLLNLVQTDIFDRAMPWMIVMMRHRTMPPDLNLTLAHRASVALVGMMFLVLLSAFLLALAGAAPWSRSEPLVLFALGLLAAVLTALNRDFYRFLRKKRGVSFALRAIPLHWLYYGYCGISVVLGLGGVMREWTRRPARGLA